MDRSEVIILVSQTYTPDEYGVHQPTPSQREVFCSVKSVSADEFFQGAVNGIKPEYRFTMFKYDYAGEETVIFNGKEFTVYRTFEGRNDTIELYAERRRGAR